MVYRKTITTLSGVTEGRPTRTPFGVTKGLVYFFEVYFPSGSEGLLHATIYDGGYQIWPSTPRESFIGDDIYFPYDDLYIKESAPFEFTVYTWNEDDMYKHKVIIGIGLVSKDIFMARFLPSMMYEKFEKVYMNILKEQEKRKLAILKAPFFPLIPGVK